MRKRVAFAVGFLFLIVAASPFALVAFGRTPPYAPITNLRPIINEGVLDTYTARDGARLAIRRFGPVPEFRRLRTPVAILIHGAGGTSLVMSTLADRLAAGGVVSYAVDLRGGGLSGRSGDIDHLGQLEEDLEDLLAHVQQREGEGRLLLAGFSSGGAFALRISDTPLGKRFGRIVGIAPYLGSTDEATQPVTGGWARPFYARFIGLRLLDAVGLHLFDGLPIIAFAVPVNADPARSTPTWSYRMAQNITTTGGFTLLAPERSWRDDIRLSQDRIAVVLGGKDSSQDAVVAAAEFRAAAPQVPVLMIADADHMALVQTQGPVAVIADALLEDRSTAVNFLRMDGGEAAAYGRPTQTIPVGETAP